MHAASAPAVPHAGDSQVALPSLAAIESALRSTTEVLARELARPSPLRPPWNDFEWRIARAVASMQGVSALLLGTVPWRGPDAWQQFLEEQHGHIEARQARIENLLATIDDGARRAGFRTIALKGPALLARGLYGAAERPMADVDLLVAREDLATAVALIEALGYTQAYETWKHRVFVPQSKQPTSTFGEHRDNPIKIELHTRVVERLPFADVDISDIVWPRDTPPGLVDYASDAALMSHLLLHAALNMRFKGLRLVHVNDIARLARRMSDASWGALARLRAHRCGSWWLWPALALTNRYYTGAVPGEPLAALERDCPRWLRSMVRRQQLTDVSLSDLRIRAFPGIEWSRSPSEVLRFVVERVLPGREALEERKDCAVVESWAQGNPWMQLSQSRRILSWMVSRPPRVETISAVIRSMEQDGSAGRT